MDIKYVSEGRCEECGKPASRSLDGILLCSSCADPELIKQIGRCIKAVQNAKVTMNVTPLGLKEPR